MNMRKILAIPKSLYFNLYYFPLKLAVKLPVIVAADTKLANMGSRKAVRLANPSRRVFFGFGESYALGGKTYWSISKDAQVIFDGSATLGKGTQIISGGV